MVSTFRRSKDAAYRRPDNPNANEPIRNLVLDHGDSQIFYRNYLSRIIRYDTIASFLGVKARINWIQNAHSIYRSLDPRRPKKLTTEHKAAIREQPEIQELRRQREMLLRRKYERHRESKLRDLQNEYSAAVRARERAALAQIRRDYDAIAPL
jgi:Protein of unknown function (DUF3435)